MNSNLYRTAFPYGTSSWKELDKTAEDINGEIIDGLFDMTDQEREYILKNVSDFVENWLWDLTPQEYKDAVAKQGTLRPLPDPTPAFCDHCGRAANIDPDPFSGGDLGWKHADDGLFGCYEHNDNATVCEVGGSNVVAL